MQSQIKWTLTFNIQSYFFFHPAICLPEETERSVVVFSIALSSKWLHMFIWTIGSPSIPIYSHLFSKTKCNVISPDIEQVLFFLRLGIKGKYSTWRRKKKTLTSLCILGAHKATVYCCSVRLTFEVLRTISKKLSCEIQERLGNAK